MTEKKLPMRQCLGCRERKPKRELVRVVRSPEGKTFLDRSGRANGRGAYLCPNPECLRRAVKARALERALEARISPELLEQLTTELAQQDTEQGSEKLPGSGNETSAAGGKELPDGD